MTAAESTSTLTPPVSDIDHAQGPAHAKVTLVEYGDYECSYCGRAYTIVKQLQDEMGMQMRFVFRNFPLSEAHPNALHAAIAAEAVGAHGEDEFWQMHDTLFEHQDALEDEDLAAYAEEIGIPGTEVTDAFRGGELADRVHADFRGGVRSGVNGTPTFFVNGERFDGDWSDVQALLTAVRHAARPQR
ncbi:MAG: DsbA family protein [Gemmatimonadota bacterium]